MVLRNSIRLTYSRSRVQALVRVKNLFSVLYYCFEFFLPLSCFRPHFLNFYKPYKVPQASKIFFHVFTNTPWVPEGLGHFLEFLQAIKIPPSYRILFYVFINTPGLHEGPKHFLEVLKAMKSPPSFWIFSYIFTNTPGLPKGAKSYSRSSTSHTNYSQHFFMYLQAIQDSWRC